MSRSRWTTYKCAKMLFNGRIATDGEDVRLRMADYGESGFFANASFTVPVEAFRQIIEAAKLIGIEASVNTCVLERDDDLDEDLVYRLQKRAEIRRQIPTRKSVQEGQPDRIADLLEEAANEIMYLQEQIKSYN